MRGDHGSERHDDHRRRTRDDARARAATSDTPMTTTSRRAGQRLRSPRTRWPWRGEREADCQARERVSDRLRLSHALQLLNRSAACTHNSSSRRDVEVMLRRLRLDEKYGARAARCSVGCDHARAAATKVKGSIELLQVRVFVADKQKSSLNSAGESIRLRQNCIRTKVGLPVLLRLNVPASSRRQPGSRQRGRQQA